MAKRKKQSRRGRKGVQKVQKKLDKYYFDIKKQSIFGAFFDLLMWPIMQVLMGSWRESAQRTHFWNNASFDEHKFLSPEMMVSVNGNKGEVEKGFFRFHAPILGGWRNYVVLSPSKSVDEWYIGWVVANGKFSGYSMIPLMYAQDEVRVLIGPGDVSLFAFREVFKEDTDDILWSTFFCSTITVEQVQIFEIGRGVIGTTKKYESLPLR